MRVAIGKTGTVLLMRTLREVAETALITIGGSAGIAERLTGLRSKRSEVMNTAAVLQKMRAPARGVAANCR